MNLAARSTCHHPKYYTRRQHTFANSDGGPINSDGVRRWSTNQQSSRRGSASAAAAERTPIPSSSLPSSHPPPSISIPAIPSTLHADIAAARHTWLDHCISSPLIDPVTHSRVHLYGTVHFAPHGGPQGLDELRGLISAVQPTFLAIEQPFDLAARAGLPYPELVHELLTTLLPEDAQLLAGPGPQSPPSTSPSSSPVASSSPHDAALDPALGPCSPSQRQEALLARLFGLLPGLAQPARVGRDLLDPYEVAGLYGGCDYVTRPAQLVEAARLFGHLPGLEYAVLAEAAQQAGVQVYSVDAPLRLQEQWVAQLVREWRLAESDLTRRLQVDLADLRARLPPAYHAWDAQLGEAVRQLEAADAAAAAADEGEARMGGGGGGGGGGEGDRGGAAAEPSLRTITAFKVSRAVAAATLTYEEAVLRGAVQRQAALQPLKYGLFARRARHLVLQVRDLCQRMTVRQVRVDADKLASSSTGGGGGAAAGGAAAGPQGGGNMGDSAGSGEADELQERVVLAVVGRQYVPYIEEMWANERSALWHGDVPRTFAPSSIERLGLS